MPYSPSQKKATMKWDKENYDKICTTVPKGFNQRLTEFCKRNDISKRAFIIKTLEDAMKGDQKHGE